MRNDFCSNYLEHSAKGKTWANHRYVAKVKLPSGKMFYFYDQAKYQNYLKRQGNIKKTTDETSVSIMKKNSARTSNSLSSYSSKTTAEKKAATQSYINTGKQTVANLSGTASSSTVSAGKTKMQELLEKAKAKATGTSTSSKKGSGSSASSSKSKSSKSKGSSSKGSSSSKAAKEGKAASTKAATSKVAKEKTLKEATTKQKVKVEERPFTNDALKKLYGVKDTDVNTHSSSKELLDNLKSYKDGAFGYIMAGDKTYKWTKEGGNIVFKDFKTDKEVTLPNALKDIQEFRTDKLKTKKK